MKRYTVGFIFDSALEEVVLMEKNRPDWQKGKLNGIGGRVEEGESALECMVRETEEETGLATSVEDWKRFASIHESGGNVVDFFGLIHTGAKEEIQTTTDEQVDWYPAGALPANALLNITWLIPMAIEKLGGGSFEPVEVTYT